MSIFWIHASSVPSFESDYLNIAVEFNLPGTATDMSGKPQTTMEDVKRWLSTMESGEWLMVIDDARWESEQVLRLLPRCPNGSIIFTTKCKTIALKMAVPHNVIEVEALDPVSARSMLLSRIGTVANPKDEAPEVMDILQLLEYHPLAISHMGAFIFANSSSISEYSQLYNMNEASKLELLSNNDVLVHQQRFTLDNSVTSGPVARTLMISFEQIRLHSSRAADILCLMVCLDNSRIPKSLILCADQSMSDVQLVKALGILKGYCLITVQCDGSFIVHNLVYLAIRNWLRTRQSYAQISRKALKLVLNKFPAGNSEILTVCDSYIAHAEAVLRDLNSRGYEDNENDTENSREDRDNSQDKVSVKFSKAQLAHRCSRYFQMRGEYGHAERLAGKAVEWSECVSEVSDQRKWTIRSNLATVLRYQGRYLEARTIDEALLHIRRQTLGENHEETLSSLNNLGLTLQGLGRYQEAEMIHRSVLSSRETIMGKEHAETLSSLSNLAMSLQQQGKLQAAREIGESLISLKAKVLGADHLDTLVSINNLGVVLQQQQHFAEARTKHVEVLRGREKLLGRKHPKTLMSLINISGTLHGECQFAAAEKLMREALEGNIEVQGTKHPETIVARENLAIILQCLERYDEAEELCQEVLAASQDVLAQEHPEKLSSKQTLKELAEQRRGLTDRDTEEGMKDDVVSTRTF